MSSDPPQPETASPQLPPLRIHHLMLWMAVSARILTVLKTGDVGNDFSTLEASSIPYVLISSLCLTGLILGLFWRNRGLFFFDEPGQMAFIIHGIQAVYLLIFTSASHISNIESLSWMRYVLLFGWLIVGLVTLFLYFRFARTFQAYGWWGNFFRALGIITLLQGASMIIVPFMSVSLAGAGSIRSMIWMQMAAPILFGFAETFCWVIAVRSDLKEREDYHWTHWVGATTWPALFLVSLISAIAFFFFPPD